MKEKKIAVVFPGIGYHTDKPLLYYGKKLAAKEGYEIMEVPYGGFKKNIKGSAKKMREAFQNAMEQTEEILRNVDFAGCGKILFISKSIGTAIAAAYAGEHRLRTYNLYYTPVEETFSFAGEEGIVFHGTEDPWVKTEIVKNKCGEKGLPLYITEGANHSLETGDVRRDLANLQFVMEKSEEYIKKIKDL